MIKKDRLKKGSRATPKTARSDIPAAPDTGMVLDNISDSIIQLDLKNRVIWANRSAALSLGLETKDMLGKFCYQLWGRNPDECRECPSVMARTSGRDHSGEMLSGDGRIWHVSSYPVKGETGELLSVVEVRREVTESKMIQQRQARRQQDKEAAAEIAQQLSKVWDEEQIFRLIGQGLHKLAGQAVAVVSSYEAEDSSLTVREIAGTPALLKKAYDIMGKGRGRMKFSRIPAATVKQFRTGRLLPLAGGLQEISFGELPARVIKGLTDVLGITQVYGMGLRCGQNIMGAVTICRSGRSEELDLDLLENFINQSAMALNRVRAEKQAQYNQDYFRYVVDHTSEIIAIVDPEGTIKYISLAAERELGYRPETMIGRSLFDYVHPGDVPGLIVILSRALPDGGDTLNLEFRARHRDGRWQHLEASGMNLLGNPAVNGIVLSARNVTDQRKAEEDIQRSQEVLRESEEKHRLLLDSIKSPILALDRNLTVLYCNQSYFEVIGRKTTDLVGRKLLEVFPGFKKTRSYQAYLQCLETGQPQHVEGKFNGRYLKVAVYPTPWGLLAVADDATESHMARELLEESRRKLVTLMGNLPGMVYRCRNDRSWTMEITNDGCWELTGYLPSEIIGNRAVSFAQLIHPDDREMVWDNIQSSIRAKSPYQLIYRLKAKDGSEKWVWEQGQGVYDEKDELQALEGFITDISERKRAEDALQSSEYQYRSTIDSLGDAIHVVDRDLRIILSNREFIRWCRDLKLTTEVVNKNIFDVCPFLDEAVRMEYQQVFATQKPHVTQETNRVGDRDIVTETRKVPVFEGGQVIRVITVIRDITEQKRTEYAVKQNEQRYKALADSSPDLVFVIDRDTNIRYANRRAAAVVGLDGDTAVGRSIQEFFPNHVNQTQRRQLMQVFEEGRPAHYELATPVSNRLMWLETWLVPLSDETGLVKEVMGVCRDLTERISMETALKESEAKYRQIFEGISEGIYRSTPDGKLLFANPSLVRMLGYKDPEEVQGIDLNTSVYLDKATRERFIKQIEQNGQVVGFEGEMVSRDGSVLVVSENAKLVRGEDGKPMYYEGTLEDVTVRKKAESALKDEKDKLEHLFRVGLSVAKAQTLQEKLDLTIKGITDCRLFRKAVIVLEDKNGYRGHIAQFGLRPEEVSEIEKSPVSDCRQKEKIFLEKYRISNSYFIPHGDPEPHKYFSVRFVSHDYKSNGTWHRDDVLIVPLTVKGINVGYLSVDEPVDGNIPGLETIHLLELFINQAAIAIENIGLYNDLERSYYDTLKAFVAAMDAKDPYTKGHSENVRHYAMKIAKHIGLSSDKLKLVDYGSLLYDIGKLGIREGILAKPDVLSNTEYQEVKLHPVIGSRLVLEIDALSQIGDIIYCHHEYYDGSGYPRGIKGDSIPLEARIIAVADAFEAMTSDRPYRKAFSFQVALQRLQDAAGTQFDHQIVMAFAELFQKESGVSEDNGNGR